MLEGPRALSKLGGIAFIANGSLFLAKSVLELLAGPPPSNGADILVWIASQKPFLMATSEVRRCHILRRTARRGAPVRSRHARGESGDETWTAVATFDLIGGYPDRISPVLWLVCGAFFAAWFIAVRVKLYGMSASGE